MCNANGESSSRTEFIPKTTCQLLNNVICQKCNADKAAVLLRGKNVYCNSCFMTIATHKFRATLGKSKIVRPSDKILAVYTGNAGSTALLHLVGAGMKETVAKRLLFETKVVYIDDGAVTGETIEARRRKVIEMETQLKSLGFESYAVSLNQSLEGSEIAIEKLENYSKSLAAPSNQDEVLKNIFDKLEERTSKMELLRKLRRRLTVSSAKKLGCTKVFVADDCTSLAIDILSNVALGRGAQLFLDVGFMDDRCRDVMLLRPMRDFTQHELDCYLNIHNLKTIDCDSLANDLEDDPTIESLTEKFLTDLDSRFHGTVSTIFRTGEKVSAQGADKDGRLDDTCVLCEAPLDTVLSDTGVSAVNSACFSKFVSSQRENVDIHKEKMEEFTNALVVRTDETLEDPRKFVTVEDLKKCLCYGCKLIFRSSNTKDVSDSALNALFQRLHLV